VASFSGIPPTTGVRSYRWHHWRHRNAVAVSSYNLINYKAKQFQNQIEVYLRYLFPGQQLFQLTIETIRGFVEIESQEQQIEDEKKQQQRDRQIETWVAAVGFGLAISSVTSSVNPNIFSTARPDGTRPIGLSFLDVLIHLFFGLIPVLIVLLVRYLILQHKRSGKKYIQKF
jgi:hypothetical protein